MGVIGLGMLLQPFTDHMAASMLLRVAVPTHRAPPYPYWLEMDTTPHLHQVKITIITRPGADSEAYITVNADVLPVHLVDSTLLGNVLQFLVWNQGDENQEKRFSQIFDYVGWSSHNSPP